MITLYLFVCLLSLVYVLLNRKQNYWKKRGVPHIRPHIIWGNIKGVGKHIHLMDPINNVYNTFNGSTVLAGITFLIDSVYVATNLEFIKNIMVKDFSNFTDRTSYVNEKDDPLTANMLNLSGKQWQDIRTKLTPTFTSGKMKYMFPTILKVANEMSAALKEMLNMNLEINIRDIISRYTVDVIGTCAFGIECNSLKNGYCEFLEKGRIGLMKPRHGTVIMSFIRSFPTFASFFRFKVIRDDVSNFFLNMVKETVNYREQNIINRNDFMNILIGLKNNPETHLTLNQISAQAFLFFIAGFETSSTVLTFLIYELAVNKDIQEKARSEVLKAIYDCKQIKYDQLSNLTYLNMIFQETLRKYPPAPIILRKSKAKYHVTGTNFEIEKDQKVIIPIYAIHHDENIYKNPEVFDPLRFLPEETKKRSSNAWLPFGDGPRYLKKIHFYSKLIYLCSNSRNCIGHRFAKIQVFTALIELLINFKFTISEKSQGQMKFFTKHFLLVPASEIYIHMESCASL